jgi:mono/diheme cytochrome c family protein
MFQENAWEAAMNRFHKKLLGWVIGVAFAGTTVLCLAAVVPAAGQTTPAKKPAPAKAAPKAAPAATSSAALVAQGKTRFKAYGCPECHGQNGEGTDDAPDLIGTKLNAQQIGAFLNKPSADAAVKGMPDIPPNSPDLKPLVAFVLSLKKK